MKNSKGITLTSLVIYISAIFIVIAILMRITTYFSNNMKDSANVSFETEFQKINLYLLTESKTIGNDLDEITEETTITFTNGNKYQYSKEEKAIYLNENIKVCENVQECTFSKRTTDNGKIAIILEIKIDETTKTVEYVILNQKTNQIINEVDYVWDVVDGKTTQ